MFQGISVSLNFWYAARQLHPWRFEPEFFPSRLPCGQLYKFRFEANPIWFSRHNVYEIALSEVVATQIGVTEPQHQSQLVWIVQIWPHFRLSASGSIPRELLHSYALGCLWIVTVCCNYSRPAWLELFVDHTHTQSMNSLRWQPHWLPRLTPLPRKSHDWWRTWDSSLGQPTENKID